MIVKKTRSPCGYSCDLNVESIEFSDDPWAPMWFGTGSLIQIFFLMRMQFKGRMLMVMGNISCINFKFFSSTWLDTWDSFYGTGQSAAKRFLMLWCQRPCHLSSCHFSSSPCNLCSLPQLYLQYRMQSFVLCPHPNLTVPTCFSPDTAFWKTFLTRKKTIIGMATKYN